MRTAQARSLLWLLPTQALLQLAVACGGAITDPDPFPPGMLAIELQPAASVQFKQVSYDLMRRDNFSRSGPVAVSLDDHDTNFAFTVDDLEPNEYYLLTIRADAAVVGENRATTCRGRTSFAIETGKTTSVALRVQCAGVSNTGSMVGTQVNECPVVMALRASPSRAAIGETVALQSEVSDDKVGPRPLSYSWASNGGALSGSKADTKFECKQPGVVKINLLVSDGDSSCKENTASVTVTCTDEACVASNTCDAIKPPAANSAMAGVNVSGAGGVAAITGGRGASGAGAAGSGAAGRAGSRAVQMQAAAGRSSTSSTSPIQTTWPGLSGGAGSSDPKRDKGVAGASGMSAGGREGSAAQGGSPGSTSVSLTVPADSAGRAAVAGAGSETKPGVDSAGHAAEGGGASAAAAQAGAVAMPPADDGDASDEGEHPRGQGRRRRGESGQGSGAGGEGGAGGNGNTVVTLIVPAETAGSGGAP